MGVREREILRIALPALGSLAVEPLYVLADTAIVGRIGTAPLGGLALASTVLTALAGLFNFLAYAVTSRVAFFFGRDDRHDAGTVAMQGLWIAAGAGAVLAAGIALGARELLGALGARSQVLENAVTYLKISAAGVPALFVALVVHGWLRGIRKLGRALAVVVASNVVNVVLEVIAVYGLRMGVAGSAASTVVVQAGAAVALLIMLGKDLSGSGAVYLPVREHMAGLLRSGRRLMVRTAALLAALTVMTSVAARTDDATLAAHQIVLQVALTMSLVVDALAIAAQTLIGSALGAAGRAELPATTRALRRLGLAAGAGLTAIGGAVAWAAPALFTSDGAVRTRAAAGLAILAAAQIVASDVFVLDGILIGADDNGYLQWAMLLSLAVFVPIAFVLRPLGIAGVWLAWTALIASRWAAGAARVAKDGWMHAHR